MRIARLVAGARVGFGIALMAAPGRLAAPWLGRDAGREGTQIVIRGLGARDLALGVGALAAPTAQLAPCIAAGIAADAADLVGTLAAGDALPRSGRALVGAVACAGVVLGAIGLSGAHTSVAGAGPA